MAVWKIPKDATEIGEGRKTKTQEKKAENNDCVGRQATKAKN